jgi:hypothetical protein
MPLNLARSFQRFACLALLFAATSCAGLDDPMQREGTWRAENINDANLAAMVADPHHLEQGVGDDGSPAVLSAAAVHRLLTDQVKPLPAAGSSSPSSGASSSSSSSSSGSSSP